MARINLALSLVPSPPSSDISDFRTNASRSFPCMSLISVVHPCMSSTFYSFLNRTCVISTPLTGMCFASSRTCCHEMGLLCEIFHCPLACFGSFVSLPCLLDVGWTSEGPSWAIHQKRYAFMLGTPHMLCCPHVADSVAV